MLRVLSTAATALLTGMEARPLAATLFDAAAQQLGCELYYQYRLRAGEPPQLVAAHSGAGHPPVGWSSRLPSRFAAAALRPVAQSTPRSCSSPAEPPASPARALGLRTYLAHPRWSTVGWWARCALHLGKRRAD